MIIAGLKLAARKIKSTEAPGVEEIIFLLCDVNSLKCLKQQGQGCETSLN